jgi:hypothetical protein
LQIRIQVNNIFERLHIHHIGRLGNAGGQGTALRITAGGINNLVLNNDVHDNEDQQSFGGGANGIACRALVAGMSSAATAPGATPTMGLTRGPEHLR